MAVHELSLDKLQHFTLLATSTITGTGNQTGVDIKDYEGDVQIILTGTAAGAGADLTFRIEESADDSTYTAVTGGTFTAIGNAAAKQVLTLNSNDLKRYIRLSCTAETGTAKHSATRRVTVCGSTATTCTTSSSETKYATKSCVLTPDAPLSKYTPSAYVTLA